MAGQEGFEPPTPGFGVRRSSRSSYWPAGVVFSITGFVPTAIKGYWKVGILGPKKCATTKNVLFPLFTPTIIIIPRFHMLDRDRHNQKCQTINNLRRSSGTKPPHPSCIHPMSPNCPYSVQLEQVLARLLWQNKILDLFALTVQGMMSTVAAILPELQLFWSSPFILCGSVIPSLTLRTGQIYDNTHCLSQKIQLLRSAMWDVSFLS